MGTVIITGNARVAEHYYRLSFELPRAAAAKIRPGQFLEVKVSDSPQPFLRKPLSYHRVAAKGAKGLAEILYEVIGEGTQILSGRKRGEPLDIIGPLGNGFILPKFHPRGGGGAVLVGGGIGVAPLLMLAEELVNGLKVKGVRVLLGAKTKDHILCEKEFKQLGCDIAIATDDGSKGYKGFVSELLKEALTTNDGSTGPPPLEPSRAQSRGQPLTTIYACGPKPMLKEVAGLSARHKIPCQVLLEEYMACGIGVCLGCPVMTKDGYKMVCKDGPVFEASEVIW